MTTSVRATIYTCTRKRQTNVGHMPQKAAEDYTDESCEEQRTMFTDHVHTDNRKSYSRGPPGTAPGFHIDNDISELDKCTPGLFFCKREVTYELGTLPYGFGIRGQGWRDRLFDFERRFVFHIRSRVDIRIFRLGFCVLGGEAQWGALALLLGRA